MYNQDQIKTALIKSRKLDAKTVNFCSLYFGIPKKEMQVAPFYK